MSHGPWSSPRELGAPTRNFLFAQLNAWDALASLCLSSSVVRIEPVVILAGKVSPCSSGARQTHSSPSINDRAPVRIVATDHAAFHVDGWLHVVATSATTDMDREGGDSQRRHGEANLFTGRETSAWGVELDVRRLEAAQRGVNKAVRRRRVSRAAHGYSDGNMMIPWYWPPAYGESGGPAMIKCPVKRTRARETAQRSAPGRAVVAALTVQNVLFIKSRVDEWRWRFLHRLELLCELTRKIGDQLVR